MLYKNFHYIHLQQIHMLTEQILITHLRLGFHFVKNLISFQLITCWYTSYQPHFPEALQLLQELIAQIYNFQLKYQEQLTQFEKAFLSYSHYFVLRKLKLYYNAPLLLHIFRASYYFLQAINLYYIVISFFFPDIHFMSF